jgi:hypothetical protein
MIGLPELLYNFDAQCTKMYSVKETQHRRETDHAEECKTDVKEKARAEI